MRLLERVAAPAKGTATTTAAALASGGKGATEVASSIAATINPDGDEWKLHQATPFGFQRGAGGAHFCSCPATAK